MSLLGMCKRYNKSPSEIIGGLGGYEAWCIDEACLYILCKIEQDGTLPAPLEKTVMPQDNLGTIKSISGMKGVNFIDKRRNNSCIFNTVDN